MVFIYVLKCQKNKFYIGKTENPDYRLEYHFSEGGSAWTKKYKPIQLYQLIPGQTDHDEQRVTQEYMEKYGIDNVRGGSFCKLKLTDKKIKTIDIMINGYPDKCPELMDNKGKKVPKKKIYLTNGVSCVHDWINCGNRVHNKNNGKGKYEALKCSKCNKFQRRYIKKKSKMEKNKHKIY